MSIRGKPLNAKYKLIVRILNGLVCEFISLPVFISIHVTEFVCVLIDLFEEIVGSLIVRSDVGAIDIVLTFHLTYDNLRITSNV